MLFLAPAALLVTGCAEPPPSVAVPGLEEVVDWAIDETVAALSVERLAGQLIMVGIENGADGSPLLELDGPTRELLAAVGPGATVLFGQTFGGVGQVQRLVQDMARACSIPPFVGTDYEGGLVSRLTTTGGIPATPIPAAATVGRAVTLDDRAEDGAPRSLAVALGRVMGRELRALGITMNFAPVADVNPQGAIAAIGRHGRSYGEDAEAVGRISADIVRGMQAEDVAAVVKHFPGQGAVLADSHEEPSVLTATAAEIRSRELAAFAHAFDGDPLAIMTGHFAVPALTGTDAPASLSGEITRLAREELGFDGLIVTDAMNMRALTGIAPEPELVVRAVEAGADMVLKPLDPVAARDALVAAVADGRLTRDRLEASVRRIFHGKQKLGILGPARSRAAPGVDAAHAVIGASEHRALVERIGELAGGED